jgi:hypothetical protein
MSDVDIEARFLCLHAHDLNLLPIATDLLTPFCPKALAKPPSLFSLEQKAAFC